MRSRKIKISVLVIVFMLISACKYVVVPEGWNPKLAEKTIGWTAVPTKVEQNARGDLHIDLTIQNQTGGWSTMKLADGKLPVLTTKDGKNHGCETEFVGTGGHRLAPGFQMSAYTGGPKMKPVVQPIYVECKGIQDSAGAKLAIDYIANNGSLNYYKQEEGQSTGTMNVDLDKIANDLTYPVFLKMDGLIQPPDIKVPALSQNIIQLLETTRTDKGFDFKWQNSNPTEFPLKIHIGNPPVICSDGVVYGFFQIMDLADTPLTPAGGTAEWVTSQAVPPDVKGCYLMLSYESTNMRLYDNFVLDISDK
jgi:hypothetical protein